MNRWPWTADEALILRALHSPLVRAAWVRLLRTCFGFEIVGAAHVPRDRAVIFAGNHASHYDGPFAITLAWLLQRRVPAAVAWAGVRSFPITRQMVATRALDLIVADEGAMTRQKAAGLLGAMIDRLNAGTSVVLHAEGRRCDALGEFLHGAAAAALIADVPVVPFTLRGVCGLWNELPWPDRWHGKVSAICHPLLEPGAFAHLRMREAATAMTAELRRRVASAIDYPDALAPGAGSGHGG